MSEKAGIDGLAVLEPLPEPMFVEMALGSLLAELEPAHPGITQRMLARIEREAIRASVIRLRGHSPSASARKALDMAARWLTGVAMLVDAEHGPLVSRRRKKRRT